MQGLLCCRAMGGCKKLFFTSLFPRSRETGLIKDTPEYFAQGLQAEQGIAMVTQLRVCLGSKVRLGGRSFRDSAALTPTRLSPPRGWRNFSISMVSCICWRFCPMWRPRRTKPRTTSWWSASASRFRARPVARCFAYSAPQCLKIMMNVQQGLDAVLATTYSMRKLSLCIDSENPTVQNTVLTLLAAVCLCFETDGHKQVLEAMSHFKLVKRENARFETLVRQLAASDDVAYQTAALTFINAIVNSPADIDVRTFLRSEFQRLGLADTLAQLTEQSREGSDLRIQIEGQQQRIVWICVGPNPSPC